MGVKNEGRDHNEERRESPRSDIQDILTPERHINVFFASAYRTLANIRVAFNYMEKNMMKKVKITMT